MYTIFTMALKSSSSMVQSKTLVFCTMRLWLNDLGIVMNPLCTPHRINSWAVVTPFLQKIQPFQIKGVFTLNETVARYFQPEIYTAIIEYKYFLNAGPFIRLNV